MNEKSENERFKETVASFLAVMAAMGRAIAEKYGDEGLSVLRDAVREHHLKIFPVAAGMAGVRVGDGNVEDWGRFEEFLNGQLSSEYEMEVTPEKGVMRVTSCPGAEVYKQIYPEFCQKVLIGFEEAIAATINPGLKVKVNSYLPLGASCCEIVCELKRDK